MKLKKEAESSRLLQKIYSLINLKNFDMIIRVAI